MYDKGKITGLRLQQSEHIRGHLRDPTYNLTHR